MVLLLLIIFTMLFIPLVRTINRKVDDIVLVFSFLAVFMLLFLPITTTIYDGFMLINTDLFTVDYNQWTSISLSSLYTVALYWFVIHTLFTAGKAYLIKIEKIKPPKIITPKPKKKKHKPKNPTKRRQKKR